MAGAWLWRASDARGDRPGRIKPSAEIEGEQHQALDGFVEHDDRVCAGRAAIPTRQTRHVQKTVTRRAQRLHSRIDFVAVKLNDMHRKLDRLHPVGAAVDIPIQLLDELHSIQRLIALTYQHAAGFEPFNGDSESAALVVVMPLQITSRAGTRVGQLCIILVQKKVAGIATQAIPPSTAKALPPIADAVGDGLTVLVDSGIRSGLNVLRILALGAKACLLGRSTVYALAADGQHGVENMLDIFSQEMRVAMMLTGVTSIGPTDRTALVQK